MVPPPSSRNFRLERLAPGVHAAIASNGGFGLCNAGIVDLGGRTVVFDSMLTPMAGAELARAAERLTGRAPDWVVNSHWHGDHIWGNSAFVGSHIVSTRRVRDLIRRKSRRQWQECRREFRRELPQISAPGSSIPPEDRRWVSGWYRGVLASPARHRIVVPDTTFTDEMVLEGSHRTLRLITYGGGHSPSDVVGYLPDERVLFTGDLIMVDLHPSVGDGWPEVWARMLGRIGRLGVDRVVPGHGPVGPGSYLNREAEYLGDLQRIVARAVRREEPLREVVAHPVPERYRSWRSSFFFPENLARQYRLTHRRRVAT
jgi:cyclase